MLWHVNRVILPLTFHSEVLVDVFHVLPGVITADNPTIRGLEIIVPDIIPKSKQSLGHFLQNKRTVNDNVKNEENDAITDTRLCTYSADI